jgi:hypothetical protein
VIHEADTALEAIQTIVDPIEAAIDRCLTFFEISDADLEVAKIGFYERQVILN